MTSLNTLEVAGSMPENYFKLAFLNQYNLILLGGSALFSLAAASPRPLLIGLLLEIAWLGIGSNLSSVRRRLVQRDAEEPGAESQRAPAAAGEALDQPHAGRLAIFQQMARELREVGASLDAPSQRHLGAGLDAVVSSFTRLCESHQRLARFVTSTPEAAIREEIVRLKAQFSAEKDLGLRLAIRQSMAIAQRRLEQRAQVEISLKTVSIRLGTLERAAAALRAQARAVGASRQLLAEVDVLRREAASDALEESAPAA